MLTAAELKALLRTHGLRLSKRLGQHYLIDPRMIERIADACQLSRSDTVVEIGAGLGALTEPLARRAGRVLAVEIDRRVAALLAERLNRLGNVSVVCGDILDTPQARLGGAVIAGAIPYVITSPILAWLAQRGRAIRRAVLVMQAEVADRLLAAPGTGAYGRLSLLARYSWEARQLFPVPRSAFFPQPDVDSSCLELIPWASPPVAVDDEPFFFAVVKAAFSQRRKTLVNCLVRPGPCGAPRPTIEAATESLALPRAVRGEALSLVQFAALANALWRARPRAGVS